MIRAAAIAVAAVPTLTQGGQVTADYMKAAESCLAMVETGADFQPGDLRAGNKQGDLAQPDQKQTWVHPARAFSITLRSRDRDGRIVRSCAMREYVEMPRDGTRKVLGGKIKTLMMAKARSPRYEKVKDYFPKKQLKSHEMYRVTSRQPNAQGCGVQLSAIVGGGWAQFNATETGPCSGAKRLGTRNTLKTNTNSRFKKVPTN